MDCEIIPGDAVGGQESKRAGLPDRRVVYVTGRGV